MNPKKKPRRCRCLTLDSCLDSCLDSSIHRFTNSLAYDSTALSEVCCASKLPSRRVTDMSLLKFERKPAVRTEEAGGVTPSHRPLSPFSADLCSNL
jgi:hypothetical protein